MIPRIIVRTGTAFLILALIPILINLLNTQTLKLPTNPTKTAVNISMGC
ncbi:MAG: hypothetical protein HUU44_06840 [Ignavibacteriaceae bacterium]|jgi:hypothetical protein|nr:hypothetical protein [Ignavibacteriaceae bacterium]